MNSSDFQNDSMVSANMFRQDSYRQSSTTGITLKINLNECLYLKNDIIYKYYQLKKELGKGTYGIVKRSLRNCEGSKMC